MTPEPKPLLTPEAVAAAQTSITKLTHELRRVILGKEDMIDEVVAALLARGHVLLEGLPGLGKTELVKALSRLLSLEFRRIQFTPDLLPTDITGSHILQERDGRKEFTFHPGPVFTNLLLADEINRASPKTQAALLEAMQERKVTIDGASHPLSDGFMVVATQNPLEQQGTYPLPEAQLDRFLFKHVLAYPSAEEERRIVAEYGMVAGQAEPQDLGVTPVVDAKAIAQAGAAVAKVRLTDEIIDYVLELVRSTRATPHLLSGASPRAAAQLALAARARAALDGRDYAIPDDVKTLALPALRHRVILSPGAEIEGRRADEVVQALVDQAAAPR